MPDQAARRTEGASTEDLFQGVIEKLGGYYREIAAVILIAVAAGVIYAIAQHTQKQADQKAWSALHKAKVESRYAMKPVEASTYGDLLKKHSDSNAAPYIGLQYINALALQKDEAKAIDEARSWLQRFPGHSLAPATRLALAQLLMRSDKWSDAKKILMKLQVLVTLPENQYLEPETQLNYAQCLAREAEEARGTNEYIGYLDAARDAYLDISGRAGWPRPITEEAELALAVLQERIREAQAGEVADPDPVKPIDDIPVPDQPGAEETKSEASKAADAPESADEAEVVDESESPESTDTDVN